MNTGKNTSGTATPKTNNQQQQQQEATPNQLQTQQQEALQSIQRQQSLSLPNPNSASVGGGATAGANNTVSSANSSPNVTGSNLGGLPSDGVQSLSGGPVAPPPLLSTTTTANNANQQQQVSNTSFGSNSVKSPAAFGPPPPPPGAAVLSNSSITSGTNNNNLQRVNSVATFTPPPPRVPQIQGLANVAAAVQQKHNQDATTGNENSQRINPPQQPQPSDRISVATTNNNQQQQQIHNGPPQLPPHIVQQMRATAQRIRSGSLHHQGSMSIPPLHAAGSLATISPSGMYGATQQQQQQQGETGSSTGDLQNNNNTAMPSDRQHSVSNNNNVASSASAAASPPPIHPNSQVLQHMKAMQRQNSIVLQQHHHHHHHHTQAHHNFQHLVHAAMQQHHAAAHQHHHQHHHHQFQQQQQQDPNSTANNLTHNASFGSIPLVQSLGNTATVGGGPVTSGAQPPSSSFPPPPPQQQQHATGAASQPKLSLAQFKMLELAMKSQGQISDRIQQQQQQQRVASQQQQQGGTTASGQVSERQPQPSDRQQNNNNWETAQDIVQKLNQQKEQQQQAVAAVPSAVPAASSGDENNTPSKAQNNISGVGELVTSADETTDNRFMMEDDDDEDEDAVETPTKDTPLQPVQQQQQKPQQQQKASVSFVKDDEEHSSLSFVKDDGMNSPSSAHHAKAAQFPSDVSDSNKNNKKKTSVATTAESTCDNLEGTLKPSANNNTSSSLLEASQTANVKNSQEVASELQKHVRGSENIATAESATKKKKSHRHQPSGNRPGQKYQHNFVRTEEQEYERAKQQTSISSISPIKKDATATQRKEQHDKNETSSKKKKQPSSDNRILSSYQQKVPEHPVIASLLSSEKVSNYRRGPGEIRDAALRLLAPNQPNGKALVVGNVKEPKPSANSRLVHFTSNSFRTLELLYCIQTSGEMKTLTSHGFAGLMDLHEEKKKKAASTSAQTDGDGNEDASTATTITDPSLQLSTSMFLSVPHSRPSNDSKRTTSFALCRVDPGRVRFAMTSNEAMEIMTSSEVTTPTTCFIMESGCLAISNAAQRVEVEAIVDVVWTPFGALAPATCDVHKSTELILFDLKTQRTACPICEAMNHTTSSHKNDDGGNNNNLIDHYHHPKRHEFIVLSDLANQLQKSQEGSNKNKNSSSDNKISNQLQHSIDIICRDKLPEVIAEHNQLASAASRRRHAIEVQFDMMQTALEAKKKELLDQLADQERIAARVVSREILTLEDTARQAANAMTIIQEGGVQQQDNGKKSNNCSSIPAEQLICVANALHDTSFLTTRGGDRRSSSQNESHSTFETLVSSPARTRLATNLKAMYENDSEPHHLGSSSSGARSNNKRIMDPVEFEARFQLDSTERIVQKIHDLCFKKLLYYHQPQQRAASSKNVNITFDEKPPLYHHYRPQSSYHNEFNTNASRASSADSTSNLMVKHSSRTKTTTSSSSGLNRYLNILNNSSSNQRQLHGFVRSSSASSAGGSSILSDLPQFPSTANNTTSRFRNRSGSRTSETDAAASPSPSASRRRRLSNSKSASPSRRFMPEHKQSANNLSNIMIPMFSTTNNPHHLSAANQINNDETSNTIVIFDVPLHDMFLKSKSTNSATTIEWTLRVDDPGECLGVGVCVGQPPNLISELSSSSTTTADKKKNNRDSSGNNNLVPSDMNHTCLLISVAPRKRIRVRATLGPHGAVKLSVFDATSGRLLDDGSVPHWAQNKTAYPQVSFGERSGKVVMVKAPSFV